MLDTGRGSPIVMIPGIQGRWEWNRPAIEELSATHRVLSFSLTEAAGDGDCFDRWMTYIDQLLDRAGISRATLLGISFGGLVATRYAARRPERVAGLILVSTPAPNWRLEDERAGYLRRPLRSLPAFLVGALRRLLPEIRTLPGTWRSRVACMSGHLFRVVRFPASPHKMAAWAKAWQASPSEAYCAQVTVPTLLITGEPELDRVVPVSSTRQYLGLIHGSRHVVLPNTGHIGLISTPKAFAALVREFIEQLA